MAQSLMPKQPTIRARFNAWLLAALDGSMHRKYGELKARLLADVPAVVLELGPGAGANFRYLPAGTRLIAIEPNRAAHAALRRRAQDCGIALDLRELAGERLDLPTASIDFVFCSLVLCSVDDPAKVLSEVRRVLRPGGRFVCIEHVAAAPGSVTNAMQKVLARPWHWLFDGCHLCRDTGTMLRAADFASVDVQAMVLPTVLLPIRQQIVAVCVNQAR